MLPHELRELPAHTPSAAELADLELLLNGGYPLPGFLGEADAEAVRARRRLADGTPWPVAITLRLPEGEPDAPSLVLTDPEGTPVARLDVTERWGPPGERRAAGPVHALRPPAHGTFRALRQGPEAVRAQLGTASAVLAVVAGGPLHRRAIAQLRHTVEQLGGPREVRVLVLVNPAAAHPVATGDALVRTVRAALPELPAGTALAVVPLPGHGAPPEAERALAGRVAAAYGATHLLSEQPLPLGDRAAEQPSVLVPPLWVYDTDVEVWRPAEKVAPEHVRAEPGPEELAELLDAGEPLPDWFTPPAVAAELAAARPPRSRRGLVVLFTGLSGSGKSTVARGLADSLAEAGRRVSLLDGDVVRRLLSAGLGFSRSDRELNIRRIGYVAAEVARHGGVAVCAPIAPYAATRAEVRAMAEEVGGFVLVHVATPIEVCEARDTKGLYAKARAGEITEFTGVSDPYEEPADADLTVDTSDLTVDEAVARVFDHLVKDGWVAADG
ncbi:adenylyl-sulfate kinase [Allonocardiopsis opalescens]|uniref:Adenylyl-sulfate kinase n=1 Tax=Allonocardiopsis opalescens TaxID=1144618 RepID=A0A2T0QD85_9ACTN|nr:adenylyl-sulfate kinase [Allonocardiopsis opalescens]PRY01852.1 sulfate adenylyltransferase [Allonocardiopsis opalescens]